MSDLAQPGPASINQAFLPKSSGHSQASNWGKAEQCLEIIWDRKRWSWPNSFKEPQKHPNITDICDPVSRSKVTQFIRLIFVYLLRCLNFYLSSFLLWNVTETLPFFAAGISTTENNWFIWSGSLLWRGLDALNLWVVQKYHRDGWYGIMDISHTDMPQVYLYSPKRKRMRFDSSVGQLCSRSSRRTCWLQCHHWALLI